MAPAAIAAGVGVAGIAMKVGSSIIGAAAESEQAEAIAKAHEANAAIKEKNAGLIRQQAAEDERRFRIQARREMGSIRTAYAASGVTMEGSALDVLEDSVAMAELDALTIREVGERKAQGTLTEAEFDRMKAGFARESGKWSLGKAIFGVGSSLADAYPTLTRALGDGGGE